MKWFILACIGIILVRMTSDEFEERFYINPGFWAGIVFVVIALVNVVIPCT